MVVAEPTALFTYPFFTSMGLKIFNLANEIGLLFVPFFLATLTSVMIARRQGADEGPIQIMALKLIEKEFITKFAILFLCVMPAGILNPSFEYRQFSTGSMPSFIEGVNDVTSLRPNSSSPETYDIVSVPLAFGVLHELVTGLSNALIAQIPCGEDNGGKCIQGANFPEVTNYLSSVHAEERDIRQAIGQFHAECFIPGYGYHINAEQSGHGFQSSSARTFPETSSARLSFWSKAMNSYYDAEPSSVGPNKDPIEMEVGSFWSNTSLTNTRQSCSTMSGVLFNWISNKVQKDSKFNSYSVAYQELYGRYTGHDENGNPEIVEPVIDRLTALKEAIGSYYANTANLIYVENDSYYKSADEKEYIETLVQMGSFRPKDKKLYQAKMDESWEEMMKGLVKGAALDTAQVLAMSKMMVSKLVETYLQATLVQPLMYLAMGILMMLGPLTIILSGYKPIIVYRILLTYFGIGMSIYVYELSFVLANNILAVSLDINLTGAYLDTFWWYSLKNPLETIKRLAQLEHVIVLLTIIPPTCVLVWNVALQYIGGRAVNSVMAGGVGSGINQLITTMQRTFNNGLKGLKRDQIKNESLTHLDELENDLLARIDSRNDPAFEAAIKAMASGYSVKFGDAYSDIEREIEEMFNEFDLDDERDWSSYSDVQEGYYDSYDPDDFYSGRN
ncbi:hypothetical protein [Vibrio sp. SCSIO 43155]|uniref:hypothetical protein n=1 Tax=Vibrio TaxID=662 RepID=UPI00207648F9|nr:hypothetical protein [Vibrio sp. SCSIO 43155]USD58542.1 hypothetical protein J4N44_28005 [Vibrio sp. SCSIO 43155]